MSLLLELTTLPAQDAAISSKKFIRNAAVSIPKKHRPRRRPPKSLEPLEIPLPVDSSTRSLNNTPRGLPPPLDVDSPTFLISRSVFEVEPQTRAPPSPTESSASIWSEQASSVISMVDLLRGPPSVSEHGGKIQLANNLLIKVAASEREKRERREIQEAAQSLLHEGFGPASSTPTILTVELEVGSVLF